MRYHDEIVSRRALLVRVWGDGAAYNKHTTLDTHIHWLREIIEDDPHHPRRLVTVRGVGYRFNTNVR